MGVLFTNNASSTLTAAITSGQTSIVIQTADQAEFPLPGAGDWFPVTVVEAANMEIMRCTARASGTLTVTRAQEGTTAKAFGAGALVDHRLTMAALQTLLQDAPSDGQSYVRKNGVWVPAQEVPVGALVSFPATAAPAGYLKRNGALVSRTTYAALWTFAQASGNIAASDAVWTSSNLQGGFSPGDGATTFRLPDARGEFERGWDDGRGADPDRTAINQFQQYGYQAHNHGSGTASTSLAPSHGHTVAGYLNTGGATAGLVRTAAGTAPANFNSGLDGSHDHLIFPTTTGGTETRPRNVAALKCIKY